MDLEKSRFEKLLSAAFHTLERGFWTLKGLWQEYVIAYACDMYNGYSCQCLKAFHTLKWGICNRTMHIQDFKYADPRGIFRSARV